MPDAAAVPRPEADADNGPGGPSVCCRSCHSAVCQRERWSLPPANLRVSWLRLAQVRIGPAEGLTRAQKGRL